MIDIHVVTAQNRHLYERELDEHHRLRADIYIGEKKWRALTAVDGREYDQFDTPAATYLLGLDDRGRVACGSRLHPSLGPTLMSDVFPELAAVRGIPRDAGTVEWTRFFIAPSHRSERVSSPVAGTITCGLIQAALDADASAVNVVTEAFWLPRFATFGWHIAPLGEPLVHDGLTLLGWSFPVDDAMLEATRRHYDIPLPRMVRRGLAPPARPTAAWERLS
jgi:acyl-homoserine lactone synthase